MLIPTRTSTNHQEALLDLDAANITFQSRALRFYICDVLLLYIANKLLLHRFVTFTTSHKAILGCGVSADLRFAQFEVTK